MINFRVKALAVCAALAVFTTACEKDEDRVELTPTATPTLALSASNLTLTQATADQNALVFTWKPSPPTVSGTSKTTVPGMSYQLQFALAGTNFAKPVAISAGAGPNTTLKVSDLNGALQSLGLVTGRATQLEARVVANYAANFTQASAAVPFTASTYCAQPAADKIWSIIGPAGKGWSTDVVLTYDCAQNAFVYTGPLNADEFKFRYGADWKANLGGPSSTGGALTQDGPNLKIAKAGTYTVTLTPGGIDGNGKATGGSFTIK